MKIRDERVVARAIELAPSRSIKPIPEVFISGAARLVTMEESALDALLDEKGLAEVALLRNLFSKLKLNTKLIKMGMQILIPGLGRLNSITTDYYAFLERLDAEMDESEENVAVKVLTDALKVAYTPVDKVFSYDSTMDDVFEFQQELTQAIEKEAKDAAEAAQNKPKAEDEVAGNEALAAGSGAAATVKDTANADSTTDIAGITAAEPAKKDTQTQEEGSAAKAETAGNDATESRAPEAKSAGNDATESRAPEAESADTKSTDTKSADTKSADIKSAEDKADEAKPAGGVNFAAETLNLYELVSGKKSSVSNSSAGRDSSAKKNDEASKKTTTAENGQSAEKNGISNKLTQLEEEQNPTLKTYTREYNMLLTSLLDVIKGQQQAVLKFAQGYIQGEMFKTDTSNRRNGPRSYFFFFGPPGVGKTYLAETAAKAIDRPFKAFSMSEYAGHQAHESLIGCAKMYNEATDGVLTEFVRDNPECVLLFDEIEKAHINVIRLFLQILGSGKLHSEYKNDDVSFKDTVIIFTSNVGRDLFEDRTVNLTTLPESVIVDSICESKDNMGNRMLPPEICSRIATGNVIMFNHLGISNLSELANHSFEKVVSAMSSVYGCRLTYSEKLPVMFLYSRGNGLDARVASGKSEDFLKNEIIELMRQIGKVGNDLDIKAVHLDIDLEHADADIRKLFVNEDKAEILVMGGERIQKLFTDNPDKYVIYRASTYAEACALLDKDLTAVFIDPLEGCNVDITSVLSVADYETEGIKLFERVTEMQAGLPIYMINFDDELADTDVKTFMQEGAYDVIAVDEGKETSFARRFELLMDELYMEKTSVNFSRQGWVITYNTKQKVCDDGRVSILFYDLKKRRAMDVDSRTSVVKDSERPKTKFEDVIGAEDAKEELKYFTDFLKNPKQFLMKNRKAPKGILLYGPPGTGKTMLARAMAGECEATFISTTATEFMNSYYGESEANVRKLFKRAKKYAPAIIFIDEIDAIGKQRTGRDAVTEKVLNALLTEMDGFSVDNSRPVFVLAATNFGVRGEDNTISGLDEALIRRFDNKIYVDLPNRDERRKYLDVMIAKNDITTVNGSALDNLADRTPGKSLALLQKIFELAVRNADRTGHDLTGDDLLTALEDFVYGEKKEHAEEYYRKVAVHEVGHAYMHHLSGNTPSYITIEARGHHLGYMSFGNVEEVIQHTRDELLARVRTSLAGRAAEELFFGHEAALNTGASSDLQYATNDVLNILCTYGMDTESMVVVPTEQIMSSPLAGEYLRRADAILKEQMKITIDLLREHKDDIQRISDYLVVKTHMTGEEFVNLLGEK